MGKIFIILATLTLSTIFANDYAKLLHSADKHFTRLDYEDALVEYAQLDSITPNDLHIETRLGICHYYKDHNEKALYFLEKTYAENYRKDDIEFYLAKTYMLNLKFEKALKMFELAKNSTRAQENYDRIPLLIKNCKNGMELVKKPSMVKVENMGKTLNSPQADYAPSIFIDERTIIFTSRRTGSSSGDMDEFGEFYEDIYISNKTTDNQWTEPVSIGKQINSKTNDANINLSFDGGELFLYKNDTVLGTGDIYLTKFVNNEWKTPVKLDEIINSKYNETSISTSPDEEYVFFTSDRPGGLGGLDIYYSKKDPKTKQWNIPKNMGPSINTPYDEETPFMHADGKTLYFCSEGHNSMGGFDVFMTTFDKSTVKFSKPQNLGFPISTPDDDLSFVWSPDGSRGYFSTYREDSYGDRDLYMIHRNKVNTDLVVFNGRVTVGKEKTISSAEITVIDNRTAKLVAYFDSTNFMGDYAFTLPPGKDYTIFYEKAGYLTYSKNINVPSNQYYEQRINVNLQLIENGVIINLTNAFFKDTTANFKHDTIPELDRYADLLKKNPAAIVEIAGHVFDFKDDHQKNYDLAQKRTDAIVKYLIEKQKINPELLQGVGYGDLVNADSNKTTRTELIVLQKLNNGEKPKDSNGFYVDNGTISGSIQKRLREKIKATSKNYQNNLEAINSADNSKYRSKDFIAPVEVEVKGKIDARGTTKVSILDGDGKLIREVKTDENGNYDAKFKRIKGMDYIIVADNKNKHDSKVIYAADSGLIVKDLKPYALTVNDKFIVHNLHYESNQDVINPSSYVELNTLVQYLQTFPNMRVEIGGHTDAIGNYTYNEILSHKRANQVKKYLVLKNIASNRIIAKGYGKSMPIASNDDEEEGRSINRRTEIKIIQ